MPFFCANNSSFLINITKKGIFVFNEQSKVHAYTILIKVINIKYNSND